MSVPQSYSSLLALPLFQGMSHSDLEKVIAHTRLAFHKFSPGKTIITEGQLCNELFFFISGEIEVSTKADDHSYYMTEFLTGPEILDLERLFGLNQHHLRTFKANQVCSCMSIEKEAVLDLLNAFEIFRINFLNILSTQVQKQGHQPWQKVPQDLRQFIIRFVMSHCLRPAGRKILHIKMAQLARELNDSRIDISHQLNRMCDEGVLHLYRGRIEIPALELLLQ